VSGYEKLIAFALSGTIWEDANPRLVEAAMRVEHGGVLDHLSKPRFNKSARDAAAYVLLFPKEAAALADTY